MKVVNSKWFNIVHNFLNSKKEVIRIHEPVATANVAIGLKRFLYKHQDLPIGYTQRGEYLYIYRTDCITISVDEAMNGSYIHEYDNAILYN